MDKRSVRRLKEAKDKARPELRDFGWDTLHLCERVDLSQASAPDNLERAPVSLTKVPSLNCPP